MAEDALIIGIKNAYLDQHTVRALRLTCKRTKVAVDVRVTQFTMTELQEPDAVRRSGLLDNITRLCVHFDLNPSDEGQRLFRAVSLFQLAADACGNALKILEVGVSASDDVLTLFNLSLHDCILESVEKLIMPRWIQTMGKSLSVSMPGFLSGLLVGSGNLPALKVLEWQDPDVDDIETLCRSVCVGNLTRLSISWPGTSFDSNTSHEMIKAMQSLLLQKATNVKTLSLFSSTFQFFESETPSLLKVKNVILKALMLPGVSVDFFPALQATALEDITIKFARLRRRDLVRIFEAEDTLPNLKSLHIADACFDFVEDELSCIRRPHLERFWLTCCDNGHELISALAQLMKADRNALPKLRDFLMDCSLEDPVSSVIKPLSKFLSRPSMAALERVSINDARLGTKGASVLHALAKNCPNLKMLNLNYNNMGRPSVAQLAGYGHMGAWPHLEELGILEQRHVQPITDHDDSDSSDDFEADNENPIISIDGKQPYFPPVNVQETLQPFWPGLHFF